MDTRRLLTAEEVLNIPEELCPMMAFSYKLGSHVAAAIAAKDHGYYNHFMWVLRPGVVASQDILFKRVPLKDYLDMHTMKFVYSQNWTAEDRAKMLKAINEDLSRPWYRRIYDPVAILGQAVNVNGFQLPGADICSDKVKYIKLVEPGFNLKYCSPIDINRWTKARQADGYTVYGRYRLD